MSFDSNTVGSNQWDSSPQGAVKALGRKEYVPPGVKDEYNDLLKHMWKQNLFLSQFENAFTNIEEYDWTNLTNQWSLDQVENLNLSSVINGLFSKLVSTSPRSFNQYCQHNGSDVMNLLKKEREGIELSRLEFLRVAAENAPRSPGARRCLFPSGN